MGLPVPYYDHAGITIYHGDCRPLLPHIEPVDLVLTDPPYVFDNGGWGIKKARETYIGVHALGRGFDMGIFENIKNWVCFCQKRQLIELLSLADKGGRFDLITWYKTNPTPLTNNTMLPDVEYAVMCLNRPISGAYGDKSHFYISPNGADCGFHPTAKPLPLITKLLVLCGGDTILDPFVGSGTTLVAAKQLGRKAIGIENEEKYCEIAVQRLAQEVLPL